MEIRIEKNLPKRLAEYREAARAHCLEMSPPATRWEARQIYKFHRDGGFLMLRCTVDNTEAITIST
jgi:hypothetical protein